MKTTDRRQFLKLGTSAAGMIALANPVTQALAASCGITPPQTSGPFYPGESHFHPDTDLTQLQGHSQRALGEVVYVQGQVVDALCRPIAGATVEIWQACASGRYNNSNDPNTAPLDPNFKYWAEAVTDQNGSYRFKTIIPGAYPADTNWMRPPHIHFKVSKLGYRELITQMYFAGEPLNDQDLILKDVPASERDNVIVDFEPSELSIRTGIFNITLQSVR